MRRAAQIPIERPAVKRKVYAFDELQLMVVLRILRQRQVDAVELESAASVDEFAVLSVDRWGNVRDR